jgi:uncharacterized protein (TIGR02118 family)
MVKLVVLYKHPTDKEAFDRHYAEVHMPLVKQVPGLQRVEVARVTGAPRGESPYYLITEMYWENAEAMNASMSSPEMRAVGKDTREFAGDILSMHIAEVQSED